MRKSGLMIIVYFIVGAAVVLGGCSSTRVVKEWKDEAFTGRPARMLVLGVMEARGLRTLVEKEFIRQLGKRGVEAFAGTAVFPGEKLPGKEEVVEKAAELQVDAVLVVRFVRKTLQKTHAPVRQYAAPAGFETSWGEYINAPNRMTPANAAAASGVSYDFNIIIMETTLFNRATGKPVWYAMTDTKYQTGPLKEIKPFVKTIMGALSDAALLPKR